MAARCEVLAERVIRDLAVIAFSNYLHYEVQKMARSWWLMEHRLKRRSPLPVSNTSAVQKENGAVVIESEFTLWDKIAALTLLGKRLKLWTEKVEVTNPQDQVCLIDAAETAQRTGAGKVTG